MGYIRWLHKLLCTASTEYVAAWFGEYCFRAVAEPLFASRTYSD
jgi:hypothetical protein